MRGAVADAESGTTRTLELLVISSVLSAEPSVLCSEERREKCPILKGERETRNKQPWISFKEIFELNAVRA